MIIATNDSSNAMGIVPRDQPARGFALFNFCGLEPGTNGPSKWSVVTYFENVSAGTILGFENWICVGSLSDVQSCMKQVDTLLKN